MNDRQPIKTWRSTDLLSLAGPYVGLVLVVAVLSLLIYLRLGIQGLELFLSLENLKLLTVHAAIPAAVAIGMTVIMISGGIDLSVGYVVSLVTVTTMLSYRWLAAQPALSGLAGVGAVAVGLGTGVGFGCLNGVLITSLRVVPFVVTLGSMGIARGLAQFWTKGTPVSFPNPAQPPPWSQWLGSIDPVPAWMIVSPSVLSVLALAVVVAVMLRYTVLGRHCFALGSNEATARLCGIGVERTKIVLYTLAGLLTGWAGVLQLARNSAGLHDAAAGLELEVIAAVVIGGGSLTGGEGTVLGTLVGALLIGVLGNGCSKLRLSMEFRFIIIGVIIVAVSAVNTWRQRRQRL